MARVCVIRLAAYPFDPRMSRDVAALAQAGHRVDVICLRDAGQPRRARDGTVTVWRLPMRHRRGSVVRWLYEYTAFTLMAGLLAGVLCLRGGMDLVEIHTLPDTLAFAGLIPKLRGVPVLLDLHECMPEFFASTFGVGPRHPVVRATAIAEQASIRFADYATTCTDDQRDAFVGRGARRDGLAVVLNSNDEAVFDPAGRPGPTGDDGAFTLIHHGSMEPRYGIDTVLHAVARLAPRYPGLRLRLVGDGSQRAELVALTAQLGLQQTVAFSDGFVPIEALVDAIAAADAGVVAMRRDPFRDLTHCMKMYDLVSMRRPVLCSRTRSVRHYFGDDCFAYFEPDDPADLARALEGLMTDPDRATALVTAATATNEPYRWEHQRALYLEIVDAMTAPGGPDTGRLRELSRR